jgi:hypothetical protein
MIAPSRPDASNPGPRGPDALAPTGGRFRRAALTVGDVWRSCQRISSSTAPGWSGADRPAALAAYAAAPRACAPMCGMAAACPAARAAATAAGTLTSRDAPPLLKRRRIASAALTSPRAKARSRAIACRGRLSPGASASKSPRTRSAQSAAHTATIRRSASLSVCGDRGPRRGSVAIRPVYGLVSQLDNSVHTPRWRYPDFLTHDETTSIAVRVRLALASKLSFGLGNMVVELRGFEPLTSWVRWKSGHLTASGRSP